MIEFSWLQQSPCSVWGQETDDVSSVLLAAAVQHLIRLHAIGIFPGLPFCFFLFFFLILSDSVLQTSYIIIPSADAVIWSTCFQDSGGAWLCPHQGCSLAVPPCLPQLGSAGCGQEPCGTAATAHVHSLVSTQRGLGMGSAMISGPLGAQCRKEWWGLTDSQCE